MPDEKLTPEEDAELRRLTFFAESGWELAPAIDQDRAEIRARDKRAVVREPDDEVVVESVSAGDEDDAEAGLDAEDGAPPSA
ncbi:MAG TPA: hypothetical protein VNA30_05820 [Mycobacteriales bacterium]|nr:hypothetical protein [Mycobacteriales bacterium]